MRRTPAAPHASSRRPHATNVDLLDLLRVSLRADLGGQMDDRLRSDWRERRGESIAVRQIAANGLGAGRLRAGAAYERAHLMSSSA